MADRLVCKNQSQLADARGGVVLNRAEEAAFENRIRKLRRTLPLLTRDERIQHALDQTVMSRDIVHPPQRRRPSLTKAEDLTR